MIVEYRVLDPQGQAVANALPRLGFQGVTSVRQGKRFELEVADDVDDATLGNVLSDLLHRDDVPPL